MLEYVLKYLSTHRGQAFQSRSEADHNQRVVILQEQPRGGLPPDRAGLLFHFANTQKRQHSYTVASPPTNQPTPGSSSPQSASSQNLRPRRSSKLSFSYIQLVSFSHCHTILALLQPVTPYTLESIACRSYQYPGCPLGHTGHKTRLEHYGHQTLAGLSIQYFAHILPFPIADTPAVLELPHPEVTDSRST